MEYACAFCGEENELDPDPSGARRCRPNLITLTFDDDGDAEVEVSQE
jgi:hypothetical protein